MRVEVEKNTIALNLAVVAAELTHAEAYCVAMAALMEVPERLPAVASITAMQTGGRVKPAQSTVHKVMQQALGAAVADPKWTFDVFFTALTIEGAEVFKKSAAEFASKKKVQPHESIRLALDAYLMITPRHVQATEPDAYLQPVLVTCATRLKALREQLNRPSVRMPPAR